MERRHTPIPARRRPVTELELGGQHGFERGPVVSYLDERDLLFIANDGEELPVLES